ncbi:MAG: hypothetical protein AAGH76_17475 [Pseudomonadota bacterium]
MAFLGVKELPSSVVDTFRQLVESRGHKVSDQAWTEARRLLIPVSANRGDVLMDSGHVSKDLLIVSSGIAASVQTDTQGDQHIARFFERGQLCTNITSAWHQSVASDQVVAMTLLSGVQIPFAQFRNEYMAGGPIAEYWREMVIETLLFDKEVMCAKTTRDVRARYRFLVERYENVIPDVPDKFIARFIGITPQGLSRYLKNSRNKLTKANESIG